MPAKGYFVRFLRFVALLLVVAIAYSAQFILHPPPFSTSASAFPPQFQALIPDLSRLRMLLAGDIRDVALFLTGVAAVTFGLLTAPWSLTEPALAVMPASLSAGESRRRRWFGWFMILCALLLTLATSVLLRAQFADNPPTFINASAYVALPVIAPPVVATLLAQRPGLTELVWAVSLLVFLAGCALFPWRLQPKAAGQPPLIATVIKQPTGSWPLLLLLLLLAGLLYSWRLTQIPQLADASVVQVGLLASDWLRKGQTYFLAVGPMLEAGLSISWLATAVTALFFWFTHDLLLSTRLTGVWAALLTLVATWLLSTELFRRIPRRLTTEPGEDQGQRPALLATLLIMVTVATLLFSRFPVLLEMVAWGSLGCWALLRGLRTGDRLAVGVSGVLIGLSTLLYAPGLVFLLTTLFWWAGYWFLQTGWLPHRRQSHLPTARLRGYFLLWLVGLAPTLGVRGLATGQWLPPLQGNLLLHWQPTLLALGQQGDRSQLGGLAVPLLPDLLAPVVVLAVGALCFNLDRRIGWILLTWLGSGLLYAMLSSATAPNWPALLPLLPALGILLAFGIDQFQITVLQSAGLWIRTLLNYLILGLILWVGLNNVITYLDFAQQRSDPISALGYELRNMPTDTRVFVLADPEITSDTPQLRFLTNDWQHPDRAAVTFTEILPEEAPPGSIILLTPMQAASLSALEARYPAGTLLIRRDHLANPLLYRYTLPNEP